MKGFVELIIRPRLARRLILAGAAALITVPWIVMPVSADGVFMGVLTSTPPLSPPFINSPGYFNISSHPVTVVFTTKVENVTDHVVSVTVDVGVHQVITYYGRNVANGEPGKTGITFGPGDLPNITEVSYGTPFTMHLTVQPKGAVPQLVTFRTVMKTCGYYQFDIGKHDQGINENLAFGYTRVLGCQGGGVGPNGAVLADTGVPVAGGLLGGLMVLIGGIGLWIRRH